MNPYSDLSDIVTSTVTPTPAVRLDRCPLCDSAISRKQFVEIESRFREQEQRKLEEQRRNLEEHQRKLDEEYRVKNQAFQIEAQNKAKAEANARVLTIERERDVALTQARNVQEQMKNMIAHAETTVRAAMAKEYEKKNLARIAEEARKHEAAQKTIDHLQRQLANRTSNDLGDDAEIDLFEMLRDVFSDDRITRIQKGERGADINHEVRYKGVVAGVILFDSKNRNAWQGAFASKLKEDQVAANADHAILCTTAFPAGKKELCVECGVIVARPGRVRDLVHILRIEIIKAHVAGLTNQKRADKREALYQFISSETYRQKTAEVTRLTDEILGVDVSEKEQHDRTWKKRGSLVRQLQRAEIAIDTEISAIIEGKFS